MTALAALTIGVLTGAGIYLMLSHDLFKLVVGSLLLSNSAIVFLLSIDFGARDAPIHPIESLASVADPVVQALALTAIVIGFGTTLLFLRVAMAVERTHQSIDMKEIARFEEEEEQELAGDGGES